MTHLAGGGAAVRTVPSLTGISHVGLTVRDVATSEAWYADVLGLVRLFVEPHSVGEGHTVVMTRPGTALFLVSDTVLATQKFLMAEPRPVLESLVMATYTAGQGLIAAGVASATDG